MRTKQNYRRDRRKSRPTESTATKTVRTAPAALPMAMVCHQAAAQFPPCAIGTPDINFVYLPLLVIQDTREGRELPSEVEVLTNALKYYWAFLSQHSTGTPTDEHLISTLDNILSDVYDRSFEALSNLAEFINQFDQ